MLVCCFACLSFRARADANSLADEYTALIGEALTEVREEHFAEARTLFARAHALYPNARTLRGLAMMAYELHAYAESLRYFEEALNSGEKPLDAELRADAETRMKRAQRSVATLRLAITPSNVRVLLDEQAAQLTKDAVLYLDLGAHTLSFQAAGYLSEARTLRVRGGESLLWTIALALAPVPQASTSAPIQEPVLALAAEPSAPSPAPAAPVKERSRLYKNPWLWVGVGIVVVAATVGTVLGISQSGHARSVEMDPVATRHSPPDGIIQTLRGVR